MSRDNRSKRSDASFSSFGDATISQQFDPETEALMSTRQLEMSNRSPNSHTNANKYQNHERPDEPDFDINTSAIERAFPEFSPASSSETDEEDDLSIEIGRGMRKTPRRLDDSRNSTLSFEESIRASSPAIRLDARDTPPRSALRSSAKKPTSNNTDSLRKGASLRYASLSKKEGQALGQGQKPRNVSGTDKRRTLADMHARVSEAYDGSFLSDERPETLTIPTRSTRFAAGNSHGYPAEAKSASRKAYLREDNASMAKRVPEKQHANTTFTDHQSFALPDMTNISELVSGVYEDGTRVSARQARRSTRFASPNNTQVQAYPAHLDLDVVPIPDDEKQIFGSLKQLQKKVAELELAKVEAERKLDEVILENIALKSRRQTTKGLNDDENRGGRIVIEKNRLEAATLALQDRLEVTHQRLTMHEKTIRTLTRERDSVVSQLGNAYLAAQDLKSQNTELMQENDDLRTLLAKHVSSSYARKHDDRDYSERHPHKPRDTQQGSSKATNKSRKPRVSQKSDQYEYDNETEQSNEPISEDATQNSTKQSKAGVLRKISNQINEELARLEKQDRNTELFSINVPLTKLPSVAREAEKHDDSTNDIKTTTKQLNIGKQRVKKAVVDDDTGVSAAQSQGERSQHSPEKDVTFLSFIDSREIALLRKTLEEERMARKNRQAGSAHSEPTPKVISFPAEIETEPGLARKSSLKSTSKIIRPASAAGELTTTGDVNAATDEEEGAKPQEPSHRFRRHSDNPSTVKSRSRRRKSVPEMTSAIILPDITLHGTTPNPQEPIRLSDAAQKVVNDVVRHDGENCMVCKRVISGDATHSHNNCESADKESIKIPKPIPVSDRMPDPTFLNDEPTQRPSQPPALALATVLKGLEDELAHLKLRLASYQNAFNKHDPSISKRKRKAMQEKIEALLREIDIKADQIYALYDVLEGQKENGQEITEQEVEMTLQSIGLNGRKKPTEDLTERLGSDGNSREKHEGDDESDISDDELPWEGIESTEEFSAKSPWPNRAA